MVDFGTPKGVKINARRKRRKVRVYNPGTRVGPEKNPLQIVRTPPDDIRKWAGPKAWNEEESREC